MKFRRDSEERACGESITTDRWYGPLVCMRTEGHDGEHIAMVGDAAKADGVCWECRAPIAGMHRIGCERK